MPWCCRSDADNKSMKTMHSGNAPRQQSMRRDGSGKPMDDADSKAVDWWRHHPHGSGSGDVMSKSELDKVLINSEETKRTSNNPYERQQQRQQQLQEQMASASAEQRSQERLESRDPLQKPYEINRELPIKPRNGNVHPISQDKKQAAPPPPKSKRPPSSKGNQRTDNNSKVMEIFEAKLDTTTQAAPQIKIQKETTTQEVEERMAVIARVDSVDPEETIGSRHPVDPPGTPTRTSSLRYSMTKSRSNNNSAKEIKDSSAEKKQRKKLPLSKFIEKKSQKAALMKARQESDHLSDVPSDVDSVTRERYLLACQMLKTTMIQKEKSLIPIEKEYIMSLLGDYEQDGEDSVFSEEQLSAIEKATLRLESDPVFEQPTLAKNHSSPTTAARSQQTARNRSFDENNTRDVSDKNPHTATRKPKPKFIQQIINPCNPRSSFGARGEVSHDVVNVVHEGQMEYEEWDDPELNDRDKGELVRFDGWSLQRSNEYPFLILGADGDDLNPRVMTPSIMEALRGFMPYRVSESNFWLKYSLVRDGASLASLLASVRGSTYTMIGVETNHGEVFGSFTGTPWRVSGKWFGSGEAFLWRLKKPRFTSPRNSRKPNFEREMEVYPYTGYDELVQFCTAKTIAVGGGDWLDIPCPFDDDTKGIGFMIDGDLAGGETNSCATFANPRLAKQTTASSEFTITNLEVWTLTPCVNVQDAAKMEMQKLFLEEQGTSMIRG